MAHQGYKNDPIKRKLYQTHRNMMNRCYWKKEIGYKNYGGRGIKVSEEWKHFSVFYHDVVDSYIPGLTLDRIDNDGNYEKHNFRWTTRKVQNNNTRRNHPFEFEGQKKNLYDWSMELGIKRSTLAQRIYSYKWDTERAFNTGRII